jgi:hypothetical protein
LPLDFNKITPYQERLAAHPIYTALKTQDDLRVFMAHHVYSVWDFMSMVKYLQNVIAPSSIPWAPPHDPMVARFINEIVLEEETDQKAPGTDGPEFMSHFELYCLAMSEVGVADTSAMLFVQTASSEGIEAAFKLGLTPKPSAEFTTKTFSFIDSQKPHVVAAAFAMGREHIIPDMFRAFLAEMKITNKDAPAFHYYLKRHIHLDEGFHGPLSLRMVETLIGDDPVKTREAEEAAIAAISARIDFWDGVREAIG